MATTLVLNFCCRPDTETVTKDLTEEVRAQLSAEPLSVRERFNSSVEERRRYVENLLRSHALADEARRRGIDKEPLVIRRMQQVIIDRLLEKLRDDTQSKSVSEMDVDTYLARNSASLAQSRRTRAIQVVVLTLPEAQRVIQSVLNVPRESRETQLREEVRARGR